MKLYHGTDMVFDKIDLCKSKPTKTSVKDFICRRTMTRHSIWQR